MIFKIDKNQIEFELKSDCIQTFNKKNQMTSIPYSEISWIHVECRKYYSDRDETCTFKYVYFIFTFYSFDNEKLFRNRCTIKEANFRRAITFLNESDSRLIEIIQTNSPYVKAILSDLGVSKPVGVNREAKVKPITSKIQDRIYLYKASYLKFIIGFLVMVAPILALVIYLLLTDLTLYNLFASFFTLIMAYACFLVVQKFAIGVYVEKDAFTMTSFNRLKCQIPLSNISTILVKYNLNVEKSYISVEFHDDLNNKHEIPSMNQELLAYQLAVLIHKYPELILKLELRNPKCQMSKGFLNQIDFYLKEKLN